MFSRVAYAFVIVLLTVFVLITAGELVSMLRIDHCVDSVPRPTAKAPTGNPPSDYNAADSYYSGWETYFEQQQDYAAKVEECYN